MRRAPAHTRNRHLKRAMKGELRIAPVNQDSRQIVQRALRCPTIGVTRVKSVRYALGADRLRFIHGQILRLIGRLLGGSLSESSCFATTVIVVWLYPISSAQSASRSA